MLEICSAAVAAMLNLAQGPWLVVNDDVMGGVSTSNALSTPSGMRFQGELSLENNGGFASTRRVVHQAPVGADSIRLEVRGDGRAYQVRLRLDHRFDGVSWRVNFDTNGEWQTLEFPIAEFEAMFRGYRVPSAGQANPAQISQVGFLIADKLEGPFRLEVRRMEFYSAADETEKLTS